MDNNKDTDIIDVLTDFDSYLKFGEDCQKLLKPSETDLLNDLKFESRAKEIKKHQNSADQIVLEQEMIEELQESINAMTNNLDGEIEIDQDYIAGVYNKAIALKMSAVKNANNVESIKDIIESNKTTLQEITKIEKEIKLELDKLHSKEKFTKSSETKVTGKDNTLRSGGSLVTLSNTSRMTKRDANNRMSSFRIAKRRIESLKLDGVANNSTVVDPCADAFGSLKYFKRVMDGSTNRSNIDQTPSFGFKPNDEMNSMNDFLVDMSSSNNSTLNQDKDLDDNNSGDVHLILQPF